MKKIAGMIVVAAVAVSSANAWSLQDEREATQANTQEIIAKEKALKVALKAEYGAGKGGEMEIADRLHVLDGSMHHYQTGSKKTGVSGRCEEMDRLRTDSLGKFEQLAQEQQTRNGNSKLVSSWMAICDGAEKTYLGGEFSDDIVSDVMLWSLSYRLAAAEAVDRKKAKDIKELGGTPSPVMSLNDRLLTVLPKARELSVKYYRGSGYDKSQRWLDKNETAAVCAENGFKAEKGVCIAPRYQTFDAMFNALVDAAVESNEIWVVDSFAKRPTEFVKYCKSNQRIVAIHDRLVAILAGSADWGYENVMAYTKQKEK